jgi:hypothetical protein
MVGMWLVLLGEIQLFLYLRGGKTNFGDQNKRRGINGLLKQEKSFITPSYKDMKRH